MFVQSLVVVAFAASGLARSIPNKLQARQDPSSTVDAPDAQATICGDIVDAANEGESSFSVMESLFQGSKSC
jgi:hypothetical protein